MSVVRLLNNGTWNKPPVLTAARKILMDGLAEKYPSTPLGDIASFVNGTSYERGLLSESGLPIIRISNMTDPSSDYLKTSQEFQDKYIVQPDDLLVSWSASFKAVMWSGPTGILNQHIFKVTEKSGYHRGFIRHAIEAVFDDLQDKVVGIGMMHLRRKDFLGHEVPVPDYSVQEAVSRFLDWLENGDSGTEPVLPSSLQEQRRIVARIEELAGKVEEARRLRRDAVEQQERLLTVMAHRPDLNNEDKTNSGWREVTFEDVLEQTQDRHIVEPTKEYPNLGIYSFGRGLFTKEPIDGMTTSAKSLYKVHEGQFIYSRLFAFEGAYGTVTDGFDGRYVSNEYPTFNCDAEQVRPEFLSAYFKSSGIWTKVAAGSKGLGHRRQRVQPATLLQHRFMLPPMVWQNKLAVIHSAIDTAKTEQNGTEKELDALLPSILDRAFTGKL